jgi:DNA-binding MarR family transcriptional regulator
MPVAQPARATAPFAWPMIYLFARIFYAVRARSEDALKPYALTPMQFTILGTLGSWKGLSSADLSRRFHVTPQTMGEMIANLERRSLILRSPDPANRRALRLTLTQDGRRMVEQCNAAMAKLEAELLSDLSPEEVAGLQSRLRRLHEHLGLTDDIGMSAPPAKA